MHERPLVRAGLAALLAADGWLVDADGDGPSRLALADLVIADYETGLRLACRVPAPVLIVTHRHRAWEIRHALASNVKGYVLEHADAAQLACAVREVSGGRTFLCPAAAARLANGLALEPLTPREEDVLQLMSRGLCNKLIARELGIGVGTVKTHVRGVMTKLGAATRTHAVIAAAQRGLVNVEGID